MANTIDCTHPTCDLYSPAAASMCDAHDWRRLRNKDLDLPVRRLIPRAASLKERLYARLDTSGGPDACWEWMGYRRPQRTSRLGYARMGIGRNQTDYVHRVSYVVHHGPIPDGMFVCHRCDNPPCGNPNHLFLGTQTDNMRDMLGKNRGRWAARQA